MRITIITITILILGLAFGVQENDKSQKPRIDTDKYKGEKISAISAVSAVELTSDLSIPKSMNFQGTLYQNGSPVTGAMDMGFFIFDSPNLGVLLYDTILYNVPVSNGWFNVYLDNIDNSVFPVDGPTRYLEIMAPLSQPPLTPRIPLVSVGYSFHSLTADSAVKAPPVGSAGGDLTGTYPNPVITGNAVNSAKIQDGTIQTNDLAFTPATRPLNPPIYGNEIAKPCTLQSNVASPNSVLRVKNIGTGYGILVDSAGADGLRTTRSGWNGVYIGRTGLNGVYVDSADNDGFRVGNAGDIGFYAMHCDTGLRVRWANNVGVYIDSAGADGLRTSRADLNGIYIGRTGQNGVYVARAKVGDGIHIDTALYNGVHIVRADSGDGVLVENAAVYNGVRVRNANGEGFIVEYATQNGFKVNLASSNGVNVIRAGNYGVYIDSSINSGVSIRRAGYDGFNIDRARRQGIHVLHADSNGLKIDTAGANGIRVDTARNCGIRIVRAGDDGIDIDKVRWNGVWIGRAGDDGFQVDTAGSNGVFIRRANNDGIQIGRAGSDGFQVDTAVVNGVYIKRAYNDGVRIDSAGEDGIAVTKAKFGLFVSDATRYGALLFGGEYGVWANSDNQTGGSFRNNNNDYYALEAWNNSGIGATYKGLYVRGNGYATGGWSTFLADGKAGFSLTSPDLEIVTSGSGSLTDGASRITFEKTFQEAFSNDVPLKVIVTPTSRCNGICVVEKSTTGFTVEEVMSGKSNSTFDWIAIGRMKGYEQRPDIQPMTEEMRKEDKKRQQMKTNEPKSEKSGERNQ